MRSYLLSKLTDLMKRQMTSEVYAELVTCVLCRVILFNAKRGGEAGRMLVDDFQSRVVEKPNNVEQFNLSPLELKLSERCSNILS